jgi:hypothetical protein
LELPDLIRKLGSQRVYHSQQGNYFVLRDHDVDGDAVPYVAFFSAFKATQKRVDVRLLVRSAYLKPNMSDRAAPTRFATLINMAKEGRTPAVGKLQLVWRK